MSQHAGLDVARWSKFDLDQQVLMIANEMNRATRFVDAGAADAVRRGYERVLRLADLTMACVPRRAFLREIARWRDVIAELYLAESVRLPDHRAAFKALLQLRPTAAKQIPLLLRPEESPSPPAPTPP